jgi:hypothetical protein
MLLPHRALPLRHASFSTLTPSKLLATDWFDASGKAKQRIRYGPGDAAVTGP